MLIAFVIYVSLNQIMYIWAEYLYVLLMQIQPST